MNLELFTQALLPFGDLRTVQVAIANLAERKREDGQTALPSLGDIIAEMDECREKWPDFAAGRKQIDTRPMYEEPLKPRLASKETPRLNR